MYPIFVQDSFIDFHTSQNNNPEITLTSQEWTFDEIWECLNNRAIHLQIVSTNPVAEFWNFAQNFIPIQAAGGLVHAINGDLLMIKRLGFWDLPKGKIDPLEVPAQTAIREISEECGIPIEAMTIERFVGNSFHAYTWKGKPTLKQSYWYHVRCNQPIDLKAQAEEGITDILWADEAQQKLLLANAWPAIQWLVAES